MGLGGVFEPYDRNRAAPDRGGTRLGIGGLCRRVGLRGEKRRQLSLLPWIHQAVLLLYNAPNSMRQMSANYSPSLPCHLLACCILSCHHVHFILHTCSFLASDHFPVVHFAIRHSYVIRRPLILSCCERVLNFLGMYRGLPSGPAIAPVDRLSSFVPFGGRLVLQRLTG